VTRFDPARRQFLALGGTSLALASMMVHARTPLSEGTPLPDGTQEPPPSAAPEPPNLPLVTASDATKRLTVDVRINGFGPYRFLVDTGADRSVVAAEVVAELGLTLGDAVTLRGVVRSVPTKTVLIRELSFGSIRCRNLLTPTLPAALLGAAGYLGLDALDGHLVAFDFKRHTLEVTKPHSRFSALWVAPNEVRVHATGTSGHLRTVNCSVDDVAAAAFVDTGAEVSAAGNTALQSALMNLDPRHEPLGRISLTDVTGGAISGSVTMIRAIQLGGVAFTNFPLVVADFEVFDVWGLRDRPALLVGINLLRQVSRVSIDYGLKEIRFDVASLRRPPLESIETT
jgi:predicted aspartyl protease